jgi:hypothetical protein
MRKVVLYELLSLDGVAEDPDKFVTDWDEAKDANLAAVAWRPAGGGRSGTASGGVQAAGGRAVPSLKRSS